MMEMVVVLVAAVEISMRHFFSYAKPVDYISGACLLVDKDVFEDYGGFDGERFPNYYEDTDLQMHIQHDLGKEVWLQPLAVARHEEHGSFGQEESKALIEIGRQVFLEKWKDALEKNHLPLPWNEKPEIKEKLLFHASDLRARNPHNSNILYIGAVDPITSEFLGFGRRTFDHLSILSELGHRVTFATIQGDPIIRCNSSCRREISNLGVEFVPVGWKEVVEARIGYYDVVVLSGQELQKADNFIALSKTNSFSLVFDCHALGFKEDKMFRSWMSETKVSSKHNHVANERALSLIAKTDSFITGTETETQFVADILPKNKRVVMIGPIMDLENVSKSEFHHRNGILLTVSFEDGLNYIGDAVLDFLEKIYPMVLKHSPASETPISLTIVGCGIPHELHKTVSKLMLDSFVTIVDCPTLFDKLFEGHRILSVPQLHDDGVPFMAIDAVARGVPVVSSKVASEKLGSLPACYGESYESFAECILSVHNNEEKWLTQRQEGIDFIRLNYDRQKLTAAWARVIGGSKG
mmetsp:Transcript_27131/g.42173  ORF Transcript_27131/g.42173 Transcript_27131/m.42173 type:complete len:524 (+) Transcript_27131:756-2327(+)